MNGAGIGEGQLGGGTLRARSPSGQLAHGSGPGCSGATMSRRAQGAPGVLQSVSIIRRIEEDEDELRGARGAAVGASNPRGGGHDGTQSDDGAVAAGRAHPIAGFWQEGRRRRVHGRPAAGPAPRVPPPRDRRASPTRASWRRGAGRTGWRRGGCPWPARTGAGGPEPGSGRKTDARLASRNLALDVPDVEACDVQLDPAARRRPDSPSPSGLWSRSPRSRRRSPRCPGRPRRAGWGRAASGRRRAFPESGDEGRAGP